MSPPDKHNGSNKPDPISDEVLSAYFDGELPRAELPTDFAAQVMQQAERQMLLPAASTQPLSMWRNVSFPRSS